MNDTCDVEGTSTLQGNGIVTMMGECAGRGGVPPPLGMGVVTWNESVCDVEGTSRGPRTLQAIVGGQGNLGATDTIA